LYTYDDHGNLVQRRHQLWSGGVWQDEARVTYTYVPLAAHPRDVRVFVRAGVRTPAPTYDLRGRMLPQCAARRHISSQAYVRRVLDRSQPNSVLHLMRAAELW
jgi:hypothetical protein